MSHARPAARVRSIRRRASASATYEACTSRARERGGGRCSGPRCERAPPVRRRAFSASACSARRCRPSSCHSRVAAARVAAALCSAASSVVSMRAFAAAASARVCSRRSRRTSTELNSPRPTWRSPSPRRTESQTRRAGVRERIVAPIDAPHTTIVHGGDDCGGTVRSVAAPTVPTTTRPIATLNSDSCMNRQPSPPVVAAPMAPAPSESARTRYGVIRTRRWKPSTIGIEVCVNSSYAP